MSVNFAGWNGTKYSDEFINQGTKDYAKSKGITDINAPITADDLKHLENHFSDFVQPGTNVAISQNLQDALFQDKFKSDPQAERAAILTLCNPSLLNQLDGSDHNSQFTKDDFDRVIQGKQKSEDIYNAVSKFKDNTNVLDYFETNAIHGNDRFGTAAIAQLANATIDDPRWEYDGTLKGIAKDQRQGYIDAAKTIWNDAPTVNALAGNDGIMNHQDFVNWVNTNKPDPN